MQNWQTLVGYLNTVFHETRGGENKGVSVKIQQELIPVLAVTDDHQSPVNTVDDRSWMKMQHPECDATAVMHTSLSRHNPRLLTSALNKTLWLSADSPPRLQTPHKSSQSSCQCQRKPQTPTYALICAQDVHLLSLFILFFFFSSHSRFPPLCMSRWAYDAIIQARPFTSLHNPVCINCKAPSSPCFSVLSFNPTLQYTRHVISISGCIIQPTLRNENTSTHPTNNPARKKNSTHSPDDPSWC